MPHGIERWVLGLMATGLATLTLTAAEPEVFLPKLGAVEVDGDLAEWNAAANVPVRFASYIAQRRPSHTWNGPADCGMELFCGWNDEGLCLAGFVADDDIRADRDGVELYVDARVGAAFLKSPYSAGSCQILVRPPVGGKGPVMQFHAGMREDIRLAGKLVPGGWTFEILVPWSYFPLFDPGSGADLGLQFAVDDYDARDGDAKQPLMMTWQAVTSLFTSPQNMMKWTLIETASKDVIKDGGK